MNKVLRKRLLRDLKTNFLRYLALMLLIVMGMYLIVSLVAAAETIITGTAEYGKKNNVEDGEFSVFIALTDEQIDEISEGGTQIEEKFSMDIEQEDGSVLRLMKNREQIDLIELDEGRLAEADGEVVLEKRYAEVKGFSVGDKIAIADVEMEIVGIGSVADYDSPISKPTDAAVESSSFGLAFVTSGQYESVKSDTEQKAEDYAYSYVLGGGVSDDELKQKIKDLEFDYTKVEDVYFQETIEETLGKKDDITDALTELDNGAAELSDGIGELDAGGADVKSGAAEIFDGYLLQASSGLTALGAEETLTADNYAEILDKYIELTDSDDLRSLKETLDALKAFSDGVSEYTDGVSEAYDGAAGLSDAMSGFREEAEELIDEIFDIDIANLTSFTKAGDNVRIAAASGDVMINKQVGLAAGVIVLILFTYVISVFVVHQIESESGVIGTLYALGVKKKELLRHYLTLPVAVTFAGGLIGTLIGFSSFGISSMTSDTYDYYSVPYFDTVYPPYLILYSLVMPAAVCVIVNIIVINKRLSHTALSLMRNEQKIRSYKNVNIRSKNFVRQFQIRQMIRESRAALTVVFGMFIALLVLMLSMNTLFLCLNLKRDNVNDTKYEYMYLYKYPDKTVPDGGEAAYVETLSKENYGYTLSVTLMGICKDSGYFSAKPSDGTAHIVVGSSVSEKYNVGAGDTLTLTDSANDKDYTFAVDDVVQYSVGLTVFMDIDGMRELFGQDEDYYNAVFSDEELDIDEGRLYSVTTKDDVARSAEIFLELMRPMFTMFIAVSAIIFAVVMYLMMGVMIDRAAFGISLVKIFGFRSDEIRRLYLNGNAVTAAVGALVCIPLTKLIMGLIYPMMIANVSCGVNTSAKWYIYPVMFACIMLIYFAANRLLIRKINRITPAEALKNRE